jgi:hypothetical protein
MEETSPMGGQQSPSDGARPEEPKSNVDIAIIMAIVFGASILFTFIIVSASDDGTYNYCVAWGENGWIHRESLDTGCYDFKSDATICRTGIDNQTNQLTVLSANNDEVIYNCTRLIKSIEVK